jgi:hypothetical protein
VGLIWPGFGIGWFGTAGRADDALPGGFAHQRLAYELIQNVPLAVFALLGLLFYRLGRATREEPPRLPRGQAREPAPTRPGGLM